MLLIWRKNKIFLMLFYRLFDCPKVNFGSLSTLTSCKVWRGTWKIYYPVKNGFSVKTFFGLFWAQKWWLPITLDVIKVCEWVYICASLLAHWLFRTPLLHLLKGFLEKFYYLLNPYYMVLRLYPLIVPSSSRDCISSSCYAFT